MKIIIDTDLKTDNVTAISASSEDANFPVANLQNDYTTDLWKAASGVLEATIFLTVSKGSAVEVMNTNAYSATVTIGTGETYVLETGYALEAGYALLATGKYATVVYNLPGTAGRLWADYTEEAGSHLVSIKLRASSTVYAGIVRAGNVEEFDDPTYGMGEESNDYSIEMELNNGADYFRKRNVVRTFSSLSMLETRANAWKFKHDIFDAVGPKPLAIKLVGNATITDDEFILFAKRISPPQISHPYRTHSMINFDLKEVV